MSNETQQTSDELRKVGPLYREDGSVNTDGSAGEILARIAISREMRLGLEGYNQGINDCIKAIEDCCHEVDNAEHIKTLKGLFK